ncbi:hypothetical protein ANN_05265 [Periplaneta americana]|uniref:Uncharacterized protein n=1 Tax=Periplaneta americana TaxID=6978 RepID=A0ABQ8TAL7_PERAM|nr:hypothetical protein ANN_05265 [Periplaneta americana]
MAAYVRTAMNVRVPQKSFVSELLTAASFAFEEAVEVHKRIFTRTNEIGGGGGGGGGDRRRYHHQGKIEMFDS